MARPRTFDEDEVVEAACDRFRALGYTATSVDDLTAATGLGKGSLYGAFGDKHALYVRALETYSADAVGRIAAQLRRTGVPAIERLAGHVRHAVNDINADISRRGCMLTKAAAELGGVDPNVDRIVSAALNRWRDELADCIVEAQADGAIPREPDPRTLATLLLGQLRGLEVLHQSGAAPDDLTRASEQLLELVTH